MAKFVKCSSNKTTYRGYQISNDPVNIDLVIQISKGITQYYPDNKGVPSIIFKFNNSEKLEWVYDLKDEGSRDSDFEGLINSHK